MTDQMPWNTWNVTTNKTHQALITFNSGRLVIKTPVDQGMHDQAGGLDKNYVLDPQIWTHFPDYEASISYFES